MEDLFGRNAVPGKLLPVGLDLEYGQPKDALNPGVAPARDFLMTSPMSSATAFNWAKSSPMTLMTTSAREPAKAG